LWCATEYVCQDEATEVAFYGQYKDNPSQVAAGVYDFSGTGTPITFQRCDDQAVSFDVTPDEIGNLKKLWWDGSSAAWTTDAEFDELLRSGSFIAKIAGEEYRVLKRTPFGDEDSQHYITLKSKKAGSKQGAIVAHADYTAVISIFDEEKSLPLGTALTCAVKYATDCKDQGF